MAEFHRVVPRSFRRYIGFHAWQPEVLEKRGSRGSRAAALAAAAAVAAVVAVAESPKVAIPPCHGGETC